MTMVSYDRGQERDRRPRASGSRRERKKAAVRRRLSEAALELFAARGYEGTSVQEICDRADVAKGTFFNYFPSKEHVLLAYHDALKEGLLRSLREAPASGAEAAVRHAFAEWARRVREQRALGRILVRVMFGSDLLLAADAEQEERFLAWLRQRVEEGIACGELRADLDVELFLSVLLSVLSATTLEWALADAEPPLDEVLDRRSAFVFDAARRDLPAARGSAPSHGGAS